MENASLLLVQKMAHCVSLIDLTTEQEVAYIQLPEFPHEMLVDQAQRYAYVGHYGVETSGHNGAGGHEVIVVDLESRTVAGTIDCWPYYRLHGLALDKAGRLYILSERDNVLLVVDDPANSRVPDRAVPVGGLKPHLMALTQDGRFAYCANLLSHTITRVMPNDPLASPIAVHTGQKPEGLALSADESKLFVTNRISATISRVDTATMNVEHTGETRGDANRAYRDKRDRLVLCNYEDCSLSIVDAVTLQETHHCALGAQPIALSMDPTRNAAFISLSNDEVVCMDLDSLGIDKRIRTRREPDVSQALSIAA